MRDVASAPEPAAVLAAIAEAADLVAITARALPLEIAGAADAEAALELWAPAAAALAALADDPALGPRERDLRAALQARVTDLAPALAALRAAAATSCRPLLARKSARHPRAEDEKSGSEARSFARP